MTRCSIAESLVSIAPVANAVVGMLKTPSRPAAIRTRKRRIDLPQDTKTCDKILGINHIGSNQAFREDRASVGLIAQFTLA
jgi:hypothetical protein